MTLNSFHTLSPLPNGLGRFHSLIRLQQTFPQLARLPVSLRVILESLLRHEDGQRITRQHIEDLARWQPQAPRSLEIPFMVARVILQDFTGVPLLADLAAMRSAAQRLGKDPAAIEPLVPVQLVVDHSVQVDHFNSPSALHDNMALEFQRNRERYQFMKWGMQAFQTFQVVPPGMGIVHQINLEYLARGVQRKGDLLYPDTLVGTDSHTTMINGIGVVGWGVGGIEAEAAMLGQPLYFLTPDVVGVCLEGQLPAGVTATDLVLTITERLRQAKVVGKFVEFFGPGAASLSLPDRATLANMAPEYGATMGYFPVDETTLAYFRATGRSDAEITALETYWKAQGLFGMPAVGQCDYSATLTLDLGSIEPSVAGPRRPQDRIALKNLKTTFDTLLTSAAPTGYGKSEPLTGLVSDRFPDLRIGDGSVLLAAITSCTNTSNPGVLLAAGLLAQKAVKRGLRVAPWIKTSLAPGSRVVTDYLARAGLQESLDTLGFRLVGYGCTTCIGNTGPLPDAIETLLANQPVIGCAVLSGNRNFEARIHPNLRANFLMSPPLVVAFALAGRVNIDFEQEPIALDSQGDPVFLRDIWPSTHEIHGAEQAALCASDYVQRYGHMGDDNPLWDEVPAPQGLTYPWLPSTYIAEPPFFQDFSTQSAAPEPIRAAYALALFGDSITTDHISPAGSIKPSSPAGQYLQQHGVTPTDFNSYGARRGHHEVMMRGTFANVRLRNLLVPGSEGGVSRHIPSGETGSMYDVALRYQAEQRPTVIFAGEEYGTGSSRDWAAKGTRLLGVKAVIAQSFERIHRSNLVGMGVLPCQLMPGTTLESLALTGAETFDLETGTLVPQSHIELIIHRQQGNVTRVPLLLRIDTPVEVDYYRQGGILPFVLRQLLA